MIIGDSMVRWLPLMGALSLAFSGCTIEWLTRYYQTHEHVLPWPCDVIILMIGTNNVTRPMNHIRSSICELFHTLSDTFPDKLKIVIGVRHWPRDTDWDINVTNDRTENRKTINNHLKETAALYDDFEYRQPYKIETTMTVNDDGTMTRQLDPTLYKQDGLHFNKRGLERLALSFSTIIYDDLRDKILDYTAMMTTRRRRLNLDGLTTIPVVRHIGNRIYFKGKQSILSNFRERDLHLFGRIFRTIGIDNWTPRKKEDRRKTDGHRHDILDGDCQTLHHDVYPNSAN